MQDAVTLTRRKAMDPRTMRLYWILLALSLLMSIAGFALLDFWDGMLSLVVVLLVAGTMMFDRQVIHIPPMMLVFSVAGLTLSTLGQTVSGHGIFQAASYVFLGIILSLIGYILAYVIVGKMPGSADEKGGLISLEAFCFGVAMYSIATMAAYYLSSVDGMPYYQEMFDNLLYVTVGCVLICLFFMLDRTTVFRHTVFNFLYVNSEALGMDADSDRRKVLEVISGGETDHTEFKSTLRTNLETGEKDKRMEKAVLKTLVAFLNTDGGTLLIGVDDSGNITGIDEASFDSRDRMNLHMTHLISNQIGDEFNPYISFRVVPFDERAVMMVTCKKSPIPVFLRDGKTEAYYVRSGPSSVELSGSNMVKYIAANRQKLGRRKPPLPRPVLADED